MQKIKLFLAVLFVLLISLSCEENENTIVLPSDPGTLYGEVLPLDINANVTLQQGDKNYTAAVNIYGEFSLTGIEAGVYTLIVEAENYGSITRTNIKIESGQGYEIGTIELNIFPYPLNSVSALTYNSTRGNYFTVYFRKGMDIESVQNNISLTPEVQNLEITPTSTSSYYSSSFYVTGNFSDDIEYSVNFGTDIQTYWGENLEFPFSIILVNETANSSTTNFQLYRFNNERIENATTQLNFYFTSSIGENYKEAVSIEPNIPFEVYSSSTYLKITPVNSWLPDTDFKITFDETLMDAEQNVLGSDTSVTIHSAKFGISTTSPKNGEILLSEISSFNVYFSYLVDSASVYNDCVTISPEVGHEIILYERFSNPYISIRPDSLQSDTEYTVTINTNLKDFWGTNLEEPYSFTFQTK